MMNSSIVLEHEMERHRELVRRGEITRENGQGGYTVFGRLLELRYELTSEREAATHLRNDIRGLVLDWGNPKQGPLLGKGVSGELLCISKVGPLPDIPDPSIVDVGPTVILDGNEIPLKLIPPRCRASIRRCGRRE